MQKSIMERAEELKNEVVANRRHLHEHPEVAMKLPETVNFVMERLRELGCEPKQCGPSGVTATIGHGSPVLLLRADMDALPMPEASGLDFASKDPKAAHTCGHDCHTAMLLGAAKLLKEREAELKGTVKLAFQPGEEVFMGARSMLEDGLLENPKVDAAMGMHIFPMFHFGTLGYREGELMASVDGFEITITGQGCHGARSYKGVDPINIGVHIHLALQELISREIDSNEAALITVGAFNSGDAANIIPQTAVLKGTIRTYTPAVRDFLKKRLKETAEAIAAAYRGSAKVEFAYQVPPCICEPEMTKEFKGYAEEITGGALELTELPRLQGSEDFALISQEVPSVFFTLGADFPGKETVTMQHNPAVLFNEDAMPWGTALYAGCAIKWLEKHSA